MMLVRARAGRVEDDADLGPDRHLDQSVDAFVGGGDAEPGGALQPVAFGIDADKGAHFQHVGRADDLDHQVGADVTGPDNRDFDLRLACCHDPPYYLCARTF